MRILRYWRSVTDRVMFFMGTGRHGEFFDGTGPSSVFASY